MYHSVRVYQECIIVSLFVSLVCYNNIILLRSVRKKYTIRHYCLCNKYNFSEDSHRWQLENALQ